MLYISTFNLVIASLVFTRLNTIRRYFLAIKHVVYLYYTGYLSNLLKSINWIDFFPSKMLMDESCMFAKSNNTFLHIYKSTIMDLDVQMCLLFFLKKQKSRLNLRIFSVPSEQVKNPRSNTRKSTFTILVSCYLL